MQNEGKEVSTKHNLHHNQEKCEIEKRRKSNKKWEGHLPSLPLPFFFQRKKRETRDEQTYDIILYHQCVKTKTLKLSYLSVVQPSRRRSETKDYQYLSCRKCCTAGLQILYRILYEYNEITVISM